MTNHVKLTRSPRQAAPIDASAKDPLAKSVMSTDHQGRQRLRRDNFDLGSSPEHLGRLLANEAAQIWKPLVNGRILLA
jgi:hypothetical protein